MSTTRFGILVGLVIGAVWTFAGFPSALLTAALGALGFLFALVIEGRMDVTEYLGHRHER